MQGRIGTYVITVTNVGGQSTTAPVTVSDPMPPGLELVSASGPGWNCSASTAALMLCTRSDPIVPGRHVPSTTLRVLVRATTGATITNVATVMTEGDIDESNDSGATTAAVAEAPAAVPLLSAWAFLLALLALLVVAALALRRGVRPGV